MNDITDLTNLIQNGKLIKDRFPDRNTFFESIAGQLVDECYVEEGFYDAIVTREDKYPTGLEVPSGKICLPHVEGRYIKKDAIIIAIFDEPIEFNAMDDRDKKLDIRIGFVLLIKDPEKHLAVLKQLVRVVQAAKLMSLLDAHTKEEVLDLLVSM